MWQLGNLKKKIMDLFNPTNVDYVFFTVQIRKLEINIFYGSKLFLDAFYILENEGNNSLEKKIVI